MIIEVSEKNIRDAASVYEKSWKESHRDICTEEFIEKHDFNYMKSFLSGKIEDGYLIFIKYEEEKPVGIVGINPMDEEICLLYVLPEKEHRGFGSELLKFALSKCESPYITVLDSNKKAIDFYKKRGFIPAENQKENDAEKKIFERKYIYRNKNM